MTKRKKAPGKSHREGFSLIELTNMFPTEEAATLWFEDVLWGTERCCGHCGSVRTGKAAHAKMPYWCSDCRSYFSIRTGTAMQSSKIPLRKWAIAIYLCLTSLKSVSSMKLHRDLKVTQKTAWFMLHRIREAWATPLPGWFAGPVEADETFVGGRAKNMHATNRKQLTGRGGVDKSVVAGVKDRATGRVRAAVVERVNGPTLTSFVEGHAAPDAIVYTDEHMAYATLANRHAVKHGVGEWVRDQIHINGMESFWSMLKRAHMGTFHKLSPKHLDRYVQEFACKHNMRNSGTLAQMRTTTARLVGRNLLYRELVADNGLSSGARSA